ncbi:MAG: phytanoyl-CoA dioxygenase family protein [Pseudomonadota bacterium]
MIHLSKQNVADFAHLGWLAVPQLAAEAEVEALLAQARQEIARAPLELEREVGYPGAPRSEAARGADTPRRLLGAYRRGGALARWGERPVPLLRQLLNSEAIWLSQAHHNCVMTKYPEYSSDTLWHQDIRFWSFDPPRLVNCWLALGLERAENGGLMVIEGSHRWDLSPERLDSGRFLKPDHPENAAAIAEARQVDLNPGDALFFDAAVFHAASRNHTSQVKRSVVYSYHGAGVHPRPGTRSSALEEIAFDPATG